MADLPEREPLPIELSAIVTTLETLTHELTKTLSDRQVKEVVAALCVSLHEMAEERRGPNRPFSRR